MIPGESVAFTIGLATLPPEISRYTTLRTLEKVKAMSYSGSGAMHTEDEDHEVSKETAHLLKSPEKARILLVSIERLEHGDEVERDRDE